jgi:hypothetical protein
LADAAAIGEVAVTGLGLGAHPTRMRTPISARRTECIVTILRGEEADVQPASVMSGVSADVDFAEALCVRGTILSGLRGICFIPLQAHPIRVKEFGLLIPEIRRGLLHPKVFVVLTAGHQYENIEAQETQDGGWDFHATAPGVVW